MNMIWSKHIQGVNTLYYSRKLRFDDRFGEQYRALFGLDSHRPLKILEIGCGPGALAGALRRWYPKAEIIGVDRDSGFIEFARTHESGVRFLEGDAAKLPFSDDYFDVTISNTVSEHVEPSLFFGEQLRVLKPGGICLVLSSRKGTQAEAPCLAMGEAEQAFWDKARQYDRTFETYAVGRYAMNEAGLPLAMDCYGFRGIRTGFVASHFTPDHPDTPRELAHAIINADRYNDLEAAESVLYSMPEHFTAAEVERIKGCINEKYDTRLDLYKKGQQQWDTRLTVTMVIRGEK